MLWQCVRSALLAGVCLAGTAVPVRAEDTPPPPAGTPASAAPSHTTCKVQVTEWVPEPYQCTRTCYRMEQRVEHYTAYRCECVPEVRTRTCTVYRMVPEVRNVTRCYWVCVPCVEERTVMRPFYTCKPVTKVVRKCVDMGHWECREVPCRPTLRERLRRLCGKDCCDCPRTKIEKVWVKCPVWVEQCVTCLERVCEYRPVTCKVTVYRKELRQEVCQVTCCKCVPETRCETYTVMVERKVPYQATRTVCVCVPYQETVTLTRLVPRVVEKEVCVAACCAPCCAPCSCAKARRCCR
ncbi:MAG TPA: hypothetical protein VNK04_22170 [Gemmataceae bacterium]|nr:hypothetical protein [Gemmataceae bacterium]